MCVFVFWAGAMYKLASSEAMEFYFHVLQVDCFFLCKYGTLYSLLNIFTYSDAIQVGKRHK